MSHLNKNIVGSFVLTVLMSHGVFAAPTFVSRPANMEGKGSVPQIHNSQLKQNDLLAADSLHGIDMDLRFKIQRNRALISDFQTSLPEALSNTAGAESSSMPDSTSAGVSSSDTLSSPQTTSASQADPTPPSDPDAWTSVLFTPPEVTPVAPLRTEKGPRWFP